MAKRRGWHVDYAGTHGTVWGAVNILAGAVGVSSALHELQLHRHLPRPAVAAVPFVLMLLAVVAVVVRAMVGVRRPRVTTTYQCTCVIFAGLWCTYTIGHEPWAMWWFVYLICALILAGILAAAMAALAKEPGVIPVPRPVVPAGTASQRVLGQLAAEWSDRVARVTSTTADIIGIEQWTNGCGYTVEGETAAGGSTWKTVANYEEGLAGDLNMADGCRLDVQRGISRRRFLIDVTTKDMLAEDRDYPETRPVHSINSPLEVAVADDGSPVGPVLRARALAVGGEPGSGKSNAALCYAAEIITTDDALLWQWDLTGKLWAALMDAWLLGKIKVPPVDWLGWNPDEIGKLLRGAHRIATVRPVAYRRAMLDANEDKIPIGPTLPAVMVMGDEVKPITGAVATYPELQDVLRLILEEGRAGGVRPLLFPLRGTDDMFFSPIQALCHVLGVMKVQSTSEAGWMLGGKGDGFGPEDTPYPGCGGLKLESGAPVIKLKYYRMKPSTLQRIVRDVQDRRPVLDEVSRLAANGRNADGTPMSGLEPGDLDSYDTRWERFVEKFGYDDARPVSREARVTAPAASQPVQQETVGGGMASEVVKLQQTTAALDAAVARATAANMANGDDSIALSEEERDRFREQMTADGFGPEWTDGGVQETAPQPTDSEVLLDIIREAKSAGMKPVLMLPELAARGIVISRDTLYERLRELKAAGLISNPRTGRWTAT